MEIQQQAISRKDNEIQECWWKDKSVNEFVEFIKFLLDTCRVMTFSSTDMMSHAHVWDLTI